jgi:hypothetical protein
MRAYERLDAALCLLAPPGMQDYARERNELD